MDLPTNIARKAAALRRCFGRVPSGVTLLPVDFETDNLAERLDREGFYAAARTFYVWEAVTQYLTEPAVRQTMDYLAGAAPGSGLAFTFVRKDFLNGQAMYGAEAAYQDFVVKRGSGGSAYTPSGSPGSSPTTDGANASRSGPTSMRTVILNRPDGRSPRPRLNVRCTRNADWGRLSTCGSKRALDSHAKVRATHRRNGIRWSAHFDLRCGLAPKEIEEEFARRAAESSRRLAWSNRYPLVGSGPLNLEPGRVQPPTQVVAAAANVSPQGSIHCRRKATGPMPIRSANVLVVNKELVQIRQGADPFNAEEPDGRAGPDPRDEPREVLAGGQSDPAPLGEPLEGTR